MLESLVISQVLLWIVVIMLGLVCLALIRQVGILYERIAPAGALAMNQRLAGGDIAPELSVLSLNGQPVNIGGVNATNKGTSSPDFRKSQLLFFLSPTCPICKTLIPILKSIKKREHGWLDIILASDGDDEVSHKSFVHKQRLEAFPYVISQSLGLTYGISKLPYGVLINERGLISALGIVNSREHLESLLEARLLGKSTIQDYLSGSSDELMPSMESKQTETPLSLEGVSLTRRK